MYKVFILIVFVLMILFYGLLSVSAQTSRGNRTAPVDFDGDGKFDPAVFRGPGGMWFVLRSSDGGYIGHHFGLNGDQALPNVFVWQ